jgi:hypothetical protein
VAEKNEEQSIKEQLEDNEKILFDKMNEIIIKTLIGGFEPPTFRLTAERSTD